MATIGNSHVGGLALDLQMAAMARDMAMAGTDEPESRLDELMRARGITGAELSRMTGVQPPTLSKIRKGQRSITPSFRDAIASALGVPVGTLYDPIGAPFPDWTGPGVRFAAGSDVQPAINLPPLEPRRAGPLTVPVRGVVQGGRGDFFDVNLSDGPLEYVEVLPGLVGMNPGDLFALFVAGDSMAPVWVPGDTVYVAKRRPITPGCYVVALVDRGPGEPPGGLLKQFVSRDDGEVILRQHNPDHTMPIERRRVREMWRALHWRELLG